MVRNCINTISKEKRVVGVIVMLPLKNGNKKKRTIRRLAESVMLKILTKFRLNGIYDEHSSSSTIYIWCSCDINRHRVTSRQISDYFQEAISNSTTKMSRHVNCAIPLW
ncbi:hypothetical protein RIR_jg28979.t1 [Rhizophagus irregularis DAOM 181602=DAOM 197198]|nr:hypothetical protein RIR_jg28979.t1 [Rhizophagus irregularis DAOM 181602=DAOM 197198]